MLNSPFRDKFQERIQERVQGRLLDRKGMGQGYRIEQVFVAVGPIVAAEVQLGAAGFFRLDVQIDGAALARRGAESGAGSAGGGVGGKALAVDMKAGGDGDTEVNDHNGVIQGRVAEQNFHQAVGVLLDGVVHRAQADGRADAESLGHIGKVFRRGRGRRYGRGFRRKSRRRRPGRLRRKSRYRGGGRHGRGGGRLRSGRGRRRGSRGRRGRADDQVDGVHPADSQGSRLLRRLAADEKGHFSPGRGIVDEQDVIPVRVRYGGDQDLLAAADIDLDIGGRFAVDGYRAGENLRRLGALIRRGRREEVGKEGQGAHR